MNRHINWLLAASLGVGGLALTGCDKSGKQASNDPRDKTTAADDKTLINKDDAARTAGSKTTGDQIGTVDLNNIYNTIGEPVNEGFKNGKLSDVVDYFVKGDRDRLGKIDDKNDLKTSADAFTGLWKSKFNNGFDIKHDEVLQNWLMVKKTGEDKNYTYANATIPASHGVREVTIPVIKDHLKWRIDVPDTFNSGELYTMLTSRLGQLQTGKDNWPADQLEAKRMVVHSFYATLFGVDKTGALGVK